MAIYQAFVTELVSYFMKRHSVASSYISSGLGMERPFTNKVEKGWKKCTDPMVGGARLITLYGACTPSSGLQYKICSVLSNK